MKTTCQSLVFSILAAFTFFEVNAIANNVTVTNVSLVSVDTNAGTLQIKFDLAWENSWRVSAPPGNWDAAWVFAKYQAADGVWRQCSLSVNLADHILPAGAALSVGQTSGRGVGVFIYRSGNGAGNVSWPNVRLLWNYASDSVRNSDMVSVDVSAIEMVYVPTGPFYAGDGASSNRFQMGNDPTAPYQVTSADAITLNDTAGNLWINGLTNTALRGTQITAPNGYNAFYCMKYECSQGQLVALFNKTGRTFQYPWPSSRMSFVNSPPFVVSLTQDRAVMSFEEEVLAYLDWTGLRPMTDLEYEKACRGPMPPFGGEFAWGTALRALTSYKLANDGSALEMVSVGYQTHFGNTWDLLTASDASGPCRVGMFAQSNYSGSAPGRVQSGATYYGIMEMSGNVGEPVYPVVTTNNQALIYNANHGDGNLSQGMTANVVAWPMNTVVARGGGVDTLPANYYGHYSGAVGKSKPVSDRSEEVRNVSYATSYPQPPNAFRLEAFGIRGVRTAP